MDGSHKQPLPSRDDERIGFLDGLRALAIVMVVGTHALGRADLNQSFKDDLGFWVSTIAVPAFFLVDGYLFSYKHGMNGAFAYKGYVLKSARRLIVPWCCFSGLYVLLRLSLEQAGYVTQEIIVGRSLPEVAKLIYTSGIVPQMYFLLSLFFIRCLSILVRPLLWGPLSALLACFLGYAIWFRTSNVEVLFFQGADPLLLALWGLQFYLLGIFLCRTRDSVSRHVLAIMGTSFAALIGARIVAPEMAWLAQYTYLLAVYSVFVAIANRFELSFRMGRYTMGVYVLHYPVVLGAVALGLSYLLSSALLVYFLAVTTLTFLCCLVLTQILMSTQYGSLVLGERPPAHQGMARLRAERVCGGL